LSERGTGMDIDLKQLRDIMKAMKQLGVNELELEGKEQRIYLRRGGAQGSVAVAPAMMQAGPATVPPPPPGGRLPGGCQP